VTVGPAQATDSLRAVLDSVFAEPAYRWIERPHPLAFLIRWWQALQEWLDQLQQRHPDLFWLLFWVLIAVLVAVFVHGVWVMVRTLHAASAPTAAGGAAGPEARGVQWYRRESARLAGLGHYAEAMQAEFLALALELDQRAVLRFHPSKTPREYTQEARLAGPARQAFAELVRALYGYAFAGAPCGPGEFATWREQARPEWYAGAH
jgi:hypothetical protein